ncbi:MAG: serine/threonine-protein kinase [Burkholderiales bacterium]
MQQTTARYAAHVANHRALRHATAPNHNVSIERMPSQANQPLPDGYLLLNYRITGMLSCGGFSIVYLAKDQHDQPVVIKEFLPAQLALRQTGDALPSITEEHAAAFNHGMRCFFEEGRSLAMLSHPNLVRVLDFFRANETAYMVMRYERGRTLQQHIRARHGKLEEKFLREMFAQLMNGLREVHRNRLLHLDIKPANIYIRNDGSPLLIDFGAARQTLSTDGPRLTPMYTPGFAPPEQYNRRELLGPWSDIYAVGATLYSCLAGMAPQAADLRETRDQYTQATRLWAGKYSPALLATIDWCLELDPLQRPQSVFALQQVLLGKRQPAVLAQKSFWVRSRAWTRRFF